MPEPVSYIHHRQRNGAPMHAESHKTQWFTVLIAAAGVAASLGASMLTVGMYVGKIQSNVEASAKAQEADRAEFKQRLTSLTDLVNNINVNLASVSTGLKGLSDSLTLERQDRLNAEIRRAQLK